jgi:hypothetical protein
MLQSRRQPQQPLRRAHLAGSTKPHSVSRGAHTLTPHTPHTPHTPLNTPPKSCYSASSPGRLSPHRQCSQAVRPSWRPGVHPLSRQRLHTDTPPLRPRLMQRSGARGRGAGPRQRDRAPGGHAPSGPHKLQARQGRHVVNKALPSIPENSAGERRFQDATQLGHSTRIATTPAKSAGDLVLPRNSARVSQSPTTSKGVDRGGGPKAGRCVSKHRWHARGASKDTRLRHAGPRVGG